MSEIPENIVNVDLYKKVKEDAKKKFSRYPSAYASMWISKEYKKRGGSYTTKISKGKTNRWLMEEWIQIVPYYESNKKIPCGKDNKDTKACRPLKRITKDTPITIKEIKDKHGKEKVLELAKKKNRDMKGRLNWHKGIFTSS
jgi:hypothetical protein